MATVARTTWMEAWEGDLVPSAASRRKLSLMIRTHTGCMQRVNEVNCPVGLTHSTASRLPAATPYALSNAPTQHPRHCSSNCPKAILSWVE